MPILAAVAGTLAIASHAGAYADFFQYVMEMKQNADSSEFWPALNFWIFFVVGHPILQPILWISDVLQGTPGPKVLGDSLVPVLFLAGNALFIGAFAASQQIRTAINIATVAAFFAYMGAGTEGTGRPDWEITTWHWTTATAAELLKAALLMTKFGSQP